MKNGILSILILIGFVSFAQEKKLEQIENQVNSINADSTLVDSEFDYYELSGNTSGGGRILKVWQKDSQIFKILEKVVLSNGRIKTIFYLENGIPIKIIETEENIGDKHGELNDNKLNEVFRANIYVFDWKNDDGKIERFGTRVLSEGSCSTFDYEPILERAKKALKQTSESKHHLLVGKWFFYQAVDKNGNEAKMNDVNGQYEIGIIKPEIELFNDGRYQKILRIDPNHIQKGTWVLIKNEDIEFKYSTGQSEQTMSVKIINLSTSEMILNQGGDIYFVYKRKTK